MKHTINTTNKTLVFILILTFVLLTFKGVGLSLPLWCIFLPLILYILLPIIIFLSAVLILFSMTILCLVAIIVEAIIEKIIGY